MRVSVLTRVFFLAAMLVCLVFAVPGLGQESSTQSPPPQPVVFGCPMHPEVQSKVAGKCPKCSMALLEVKAGTGEEGFFTCPMHPEIQAAQPGTCPKCKMKLVKAAPPESSDYIVRVETKPKVVKAGENVQLRFTILHPVEEKQIRDFNILHDMPFHLFIVSQDLEHFDHIHPTKQEDGSFVIDTVLPKAGHYKIFCDFFPAGGTPQVVHLNLVTAGYAGDLMASQAKLSADTSFVKTLEGTRFELQFEPARFVAGKPAELKYHLVDTATNQPVNDLKPYLGAWGHTLILSEDGSDYLHSHPIEMIPEDVDRTKLTSPADVAFETFFPHPGHYRIWSQFQRNAKIITVSFTVHVPRLQ